MVKWTGYHMIETNPLDNVMCNFKELLKNCMHNKHYLKNGTRCNIQWTNT